ncbi:hypothetical protein GCM10010329_30700 [Streptomyces spiroverticillatus]|uniref:Uncharacterized protein n=1 Tax=Streptomyces finlayi TaxID=67296 RepID=A0A918WW08_9ACTN|nr:hypothetical protein [Streptomyces finlayi]GHA06046.1 hypothetical protein GCM10010329_30700 [Streptomyces spiroverticillatus]GHC89710.1 hypothetical protein GCM10010334_23110 [Streptomyces finlayi]
MVRIPRPLPPVTRFVDGRVRAYDLAGGATGVLSSAVSVRPAPGDEVGHAVATDLRHAYYTTLHAVVCLATADSTEVWRSPFEPRTDEEFGSLPSCMLSWDGRVLWVYRPDAMAGRNGRDQWAALDTATGKVLAQVELETVGHGGHQLRHPADDRVFVDVGEGQDGAVVHRAELRGDRIDLTCYPWRDRCLIDLAPDGRHFMTVDHGQADVTVHTCPDGEPVFTLTVDAFGHDPDLVCVAWSGGYLTPDTLVVTLTGETEEGEEWMRRYRVDAQTGVIQEEFDAGSDNPYDPYDFYPLGDGTWLTTSPSGHPVRRRQAVAGSL